MKKRQGKDQRRSGRPISRHSASSREVEILYDDGSLVAVNKPPGLLAVPVKGIEAVSALSIVSSYLKKQGQRAFVVHRIDRFTSGILLFAKTEEDRSVLIRRFLAHTPVRKYLAVVRGHLKAQEGTLVHYLRRTGMHQRLAKEGHADASRAELQYLVRRSLRAASLVEVTLITGLQNQIRVQFSAIGHPVVGDRKYRPEEASERLISRVALHACHLEMVHPQSGQTVRIDCEPPDDFASLVKALGDARA